MARPTSFTTDLGDSICASLAEGKSLRKICELDGMPAMSSVLLWVVKGDRGDETYAAFSEQYRRAREAQTEILMDEVVEIADDGRRDYRKDGEGQVVVDHDHISRSKLRVETRFRAAAKMHPRRYGEKIQTEHSGSIALSHEQALEELNGTESDDPEGTGATPPAA